MNDLRAECPVCGFPLSKLGGADEEDWLDSRFTEIEFYCHLCRDDVKVSKDDIIEQKEV